MPQWRDFRERFRPAGTPGAAGRPGVPADRGADLAAELTPLLALLDDVQDEASHIRCAADRRAEQIRAAAARQAAEIVADARQEGDDVRLRAEADALREAEALTDEMRARTAAEIAALRTQAGERLPHCVDTVAAQARQWLDELGRPAPGGNKR